MQCRTVLLATGFNKGRTAERGNLQSQGDDAKTTAAAQADGDERGAKRLVLVCHGLDEDDKLIVLNIDEAAFDADVGVALGVAADDVAATGAKRHAVHPGRAALRKAAPARPAFVACPCGKHP